MTVQICRAATGPTACYAERELKRYLRKYSGAAFGEGAELTFRLELQKTMLYSWVEFDGNMYVQQNSCGGIQALLEYCAGGRAAALPSTASASTTGAPRRTA